jgi:hypothetical protein
MKVHKAHSVIVRQAQRRSDPLLHRLNVRVSAPLQRLCSGGVPVINIIISSSSISSSGVTHCLTGWHGERRLAGTCRAARQAVASACHRASQTCPALLADP